jgi:plastocyanin
MRQYCALAAVLALASPAHAGELVVTLQTPRGAAVRNAVVTLYPAGRPAPVDAARRNYRVVQQDLQFSPFVLVVPVGAQVSFPNLDNVLHHVYSFSRTKQFELKLYAKAQSRAVRFDTAGAVPIGCNIHDNMTAFIKVVDTGLAAQSDGNGKAVFANVPRGPLIARIWHPYLRAPGNQIEMRWTGTPGLQAQAVRLNLRAPPRPSANY